MERLFERHHEVGFDVLAPFRESGGILGVSPTGSGAGAEELFEEIAEAGAVELEIEAGGTAVTGLLPAGTGAVTGRVELGLVAPMGAQLIVFLAFRGIAEDFVGFVDLLELVFGAAFVFGDVGMVFAGELAKGLADFVIARAPVHTQDLVIVLKLYRHGIQGGVGGSRLSFGVFDRDIAAALGGPNPEEHRILLGAPAEADGIVSIGDGLAVDLEDDLAGAESGGVGG